MQLSSYLKAYPSEDHAGHLVLFSTYQLSKILINQETYKSMEQGTLSSDNEEILANLGMLVPDREEEKKSALTLIDKINKMNSGMDFIVVLNLDCNFACKYCF